MRSAPSRQRRVFCNRTLNLRSIRAIGYDMDYTLIHYNVAEWERRAYEHVKQQLAARGWPVAQLSFEDSFIRGLVIDLELGNIVKANRFGYVKRGVHGTRPIPFDELKPAYARTIVDLQEDRWQFMNTFFSLSEACLYAQLVDLLDAHQIPQVLGYADLYRTIKQTLDAAHMEGELKREIIADPARFVERDPETPLALLDQKQAGKSLLLITNSEWSYTAPMMSYAFDDALPGDMTWRDLFDVAIVSARKPLFFTAAGALFEVVSEDGLLRPALGLGDGGVYLGGCVDHVERYLGASGDEILYMGDHIFGDVHVSKRIQRWRTGLVVRELEDEIAHVEAFADQQRLLHALMADKEALEDALCALRLAAQRRRAGRDGSDGSDAASDQTIVQTSVQTIVQTIVQTSVQTSVQTIDHAGAEADLRARLAALDERIAPLAAAAASLASPRWGLLMRAGNDKSHMARQIERYADIYTSRVSNFLALTPFKYLRSARGDLPHDLAADIARAVDGSYGGADADGDREGGGAGGS